MRVLVLVLLIVGYASSAEILKDALRASSSGSSRVTTRPPFPTSRSSARPTTTTRPYIYCHYCGDLGRPCPQPFYRSHPNVRTAQSYNGFCEKISPNNGGLGPFTRGAANPGDCSRSGCSTKYINGQLMEVCCCRRDYCNMGITSAKSTWTLMLITLAMLLLFRKF